MDSRHVLVSQDVLRADTLQTNSEGREKGRPKSRHFPPPWSVEEMNEACFIVRDRGGAGPTAAAGYFFFPRTRAICAGIVKICSGNVSVKR